MTVRGKANEWLRRYLPLEIAGWIGELGAAALVYLWTGSLAAAAAAATIGSSVGYYLAMSTRCGGAPSRTTAPG